MELALLHMKKLKIFLHSNVLFLVCFIIVLFLSFLRIHFFQSHYNSSTKNLTGMIDSIKIDGSQVQIVVNGKEKVLAFYYAKTEEELKDMEKLEIGATISVGGNMEYPSENSNFGLFNYRTYLKGKNIFWILQATNISLMKEASGFYQFKNWMISRIKKLKTASYLEAFLLGDSSDLEQKASYQELGISHLFAVSGMHISFFSMMLFKISCFFLKKQRYSFGIVISFLTLYIFLLGGSASALRAYLLFLISYCNQTWKLSISSLKSLGLAFLFLLFYNPFYLFQIGFQFSFLISFFLILTRRNKTSYWKSLFYTSLISCCAGFPLSIYYYYQFHLGSIFFNLIAVPFVSFLLFPFSFLVFLFPFLEPLYQRLIVVFQIFVNIFENFSFLKITFAAAPTYFYILYYIMLLLVFTMNKKIGVLYFIFAVFHFCIPYWNANYWIDMIEIGQGDAILIRYPKLEKVILVDTGGKIEYESEAWKKRKTKSQVDSVLLPFFRSLGIKKIDVLILTHGDQDHVGNAEELLECFQVRQILFNSGFDQKIEKDIMEKANQKQIPYEKIAKGDFLIGNQIFHFLNGSNNKNENEDSLVFYTKLNHWNILFMGDIGNLTEKTILEEYNLPKMDILKVGHHGSKNSTSNSLLEKITPMISLISAGKGNLYGHPHEEVLEKLNAYHSSIYVTKKQGGIRICLGIFLEIQTCFS